MGKGWTKADKKWTHFSHLKHTPPKSHSEHLRRNRKNSTTNFCSTNNSLGWGYTDVVSQTLLFCVYAGSVLFYHPLTEPKRTPSKPQWFWPKEHLAVGEVLVRTLDFELDASSVWPPPCAGVPTAPGSPPVFSTMTDSRWRWISCARGVRASTQNTGDGRSVDPFLQVEADSGWPRKH